MKIQPTINTLRTGLANGIRKFKSVAKVINLRQRKSHGHGKTEWDGTRLVRDTDSRAQHEHMGKHFDFFV